MVEDTERKDRRKGMIDTLEMFEKLHELTGHHGLVEVIRDERKKLQKKEAQ